MPSFEHDGASIYYEEFGQGFPILTFAPAGLQSVIDVWSRPSAPVNPTTEFATDFRVIAMDQRNAGGQSRAPITAQDGWHTYRGRPHRPARPPGDRPVPPVRPVHRRVLHHEPAEGPAPAHRVRRARAAHRARGRHAADPLRQIRSVGRDPRRTTRRPPTQVLDAFYQNLYGPGFVYSVDRAFVSSCQTPCLVLAGNDEAHPFADLRGGGEAAPRRRVHPRSGRKGAALVAAKARMKQFLSAHTPVRA